MWSNRGSSNILESTKPLAASRLHKSLLWKPCSIWFDSLYLYHFHGGFPGRKLWLKKTRYIPISPSSWILAIISFIHQTSRRKYPRDVSMISHYQTPESPGQVTWHRRFPTSSAWPPHSAGVPHQPGMWDLSLMSDVIWCLKGLRMNSGWNAGKKWIHLRLILRLAVLRWKEGWLKKGGYWTQHSGWTSPCL